MLDRLQSAKRAARGAPHERTQRRQAHQQRYRECAERQMLDHSRIPGYRVRALAPSPATRSSRAGSSAKRGWSATTCGEFKVARASSGISRVSPVSGSFQAESDSTKYEIAQRSSSLIESPNEGIGVPSRPRVSVRKMSRTVDPPLNWPRVKSAGRIGNFRSSVSSAADSPSPLPPSPWHWKHLALR